MSYIKKVLRYSVLYTAKCLGLFSLSRYLTRSALRILCYHGAAIDDEYCYSPGTFMTGATFRRRMAFLKRWCPILGLDEAVQRQNDGTLPDHATVITIDDGWYGTYSVFFPVLKEFGFKATLYITSYYVLKQTQVFNMFVGYLLWRHSDRSIDLAHIDSSLEGVFALSDPKDRGNAYKQILTYAETALDARDRQRLAERIAQELGHDVQHVCSARILALMTGEEIREMADSGIDIQLHTHRHRLPADDRRAMELEISENAAVLRELTRAPLVHLCYPSGFYVAQQLPWLEALGLRTATTTMRGFNYPETPRLELRRFLDSEAICDIEFEAELSGFFELIRRVGTRTAPQRSPALTRGTTGSQRSRE